MWKRVLKLERCGVFVARMQLLELQKAAERYYFGIRKSLVEYDEVMEVCEQHRNILWHRTGISASLKINPRYLLFD